MTGPSIYDQVRAKLLTLGVSNAPTATPLLEDPGLLKLLVALERALQAASFSEVQAAVSEIEAQLDSIGKRPLLVFAYMYLRFSDLTPKIREPDAPLQDGRVRKSAVFTRDLSDEELLIGLWATVQYDRDGAQMLRWVYGTKRDE